ncbi:MAG: hypothetical protein AAGI08_00560 [Bacteroidota bacterium]
MGQKTIVVGKVGLVILALSAASLGCGGNLDSAKGNGSQQMPWTNFEARLLPDGRIYSEIDSIAIDNIAGFDLLVRTEVGYAEADTGGAVYSFLTNRTSATVETISLGGRETLAGQVFYNEDGFFVLRRTWYNQMDTLGFALSDIVGSSRRVTGFCVGYSSDVVMVYDGNNKNYYNYGLDVVSSDTTLDCSPELEKLTLF